MRDKSNDDVVCQNHERDNRANSAWNRLETPLLVVRQGNRIRVSVESMKKALGLFTSLHYLVLIIILNPK